MNGCRTHPEPINPGSRSWEIRPKVLASSLPSPTNLGIFSSFRLRALWMSFEVLVLRHSYGATRPQFIRDDAAFNTIASLLPTTSLHVPLRLASYTHACHMLDMHLRLLPPDISRGNRVGRRLVLSEGLLLLLSLREASPVHATSKFDRLLAHSPRQENSAYTDRIKRQTLESSAQHQQRVWLACHSPSLRAPLQT